MRRPTLIAAVVIAAICAAAAFVCFQRYTDYGIFIAGGNRYWIRRAAQAEDPAEAKAHLGRVIAATQYGVNVAENAVADLERREDRVRLWSLLIELAPNDTWRAIYTWRKTRE